MIFDDDEIDFNQINYDSDDKDDSDDTEYDSEDYDDDFNYEDLEEEEEEEEDDILFEDVKKSIEFIQKNYNFFNKNTNKSVGVYNIYLDDNDDGLRLIENVTKDNLDLNEMGILKKKTLFEHIQNARISSNSRIFNLQKIVVYNFNIKYDRLIDLFDDEEEYEDIECMLKKVDKLKDIEFNDSIEQFHNFNNLFILFIPKNSGDKVKRKTSKNKKKANQKSRVTKKNK